MRETAIDVGKWINAGYSKGNSSNTTTHHDTSSFMEQRLARNNIKGVSNNYNNKDHLSE